MPSEIDLVIGADYRQVRGEKRVVTLLDFTGAYVELKGLRRSKKLKGDFVREYRIIDPEKVTRIIKKRNKSRKKKARK